MLPDRAAVAGSSTKVYHTLANTTMHVQVSAHFDKDTYMHVKIHTPAAPARLEMLTHTGTDSPAMFETLCQVRWLMLDARHEHLMQVAKTRLASAP